MVNLWIYVHILYIKYQIMISRCKIYIGLSGQVIDTQNHPEITYSIAEIISKVSE